MTKTTRTSRQTAHRPTADERREQVLAAAIEEFAEHGYHAAKTAAIAERAGISQPYIYALFENKKVLFLAVQDLVAQRIRDTFGAVPIEPGPPATVLRALGLRFRSLMDDNHALFRCQLQGYAATSESDIQEHMRTLYMRNFDWIKELTGLDDLTVARFAATGLLMNVGAALGLPDSYSFAPPVA